jgi:hypothetical protein
MRSGCLLTVLLLYLLTTACRRQPKPLSFYYWKTEFSLGAVEKHVLQEHQVQRLYVRYFDIDFAPDDSEPKPVSPIQLNNDIKAYTIVPVVYIKNRTFEKLDTTGVTRLAKNVFRLVSQISQSRQLPVEEIQFDCDWTDGTKDKYFHFIRQYRALSNQRISSTIRLHQVKYKARTGIPPVDHGVLMYYNMGTINTGDQNSIYDKDIASRYNTFIAAYPLALDIALPIFSWGYTIREGKVVQLLNKINPGYFKNDTNFIPAGPNKFLAKQACFKAGYYFKQQDTVKLEQVSAKSLLNITEAINRYAGHRIQQVIVYDLDSANIVQYEKGIFKKILDHLD